MTIHQINNIYIASRVDLHYVERELSLTVSQPLYMITKFSSVQQLHIRETSACNIQNNTTNELHDISLTLPLRVFDVSLRYADLIGLCISRTARVLSLIQFL